MRKRELSHIASGLVVPAIISAAISIGCLNTNSKTAEPPWREAFPSAQDIRRVPLQPHTIAKTRLFVVESPTRTLGYIVEKQVTSRSGPFEIMVAIDTDFRVQLTKVLDYPHARGRQVLSKRFTQQFEEKGPADQIRLGEDIDAISGATISSRVMTDGVREAVELVRSRFAKLYE